MSHYLLMTKYYETGLIILKVFRIKEIKLDYMTLTFRTASPILCFSGDCPDT